MTRVPTSSDETTSRGRLGAAPLVGILGLLAACNVLPETTETAESPWDSFEAAKQAYDSITPTQTSAEELAALGYDPEETPNVRVLPYIQIIERFLPRDTIDIRTLDPNLRACIESRERCWGYEVAPGFTDRQREGNVLLDVFGFKRTTVTTGWRFTALIVLKDDVVQYKIWGGTPRIEETKVETNPLGPLQELDSIVRPKPYVIP